jgi:hypothetical protein
MSGKATEESSGAGDLQSENASRNAWTILLCRQLVIRDVMEVLGLMKLLWELLHRQRLCLRG